MLGGHPQRQRVVAAGPGHGEGQPLLAVHPLGPQQPAQQVQRLLAGQRGHPAHEGVVQLREWAQAGHHGVHRPVGQHPAHLPGIAQVVQHEQHAAAGQAPAQRGAQCCFVLGELRPLGTGLGEQLGEHPAGAAGLLGLAARRDVQHAVAEGVRERAGHPYRERRAADAPGAVQCHHPAFPVGHEVGPHRVLQRGAAHEQLRRGRQVAAGAGGLGPERPCVLAPQDAGVEGLQGLRGHGAQCVAQRGAQPGEDPQGLGGLARPGQGAHQLAPGALAQRAECHHPLELGDGALRLGAGGERPAQLAQVEVLGAQLRREARRARAGQRVGEGAAAPGAHGGGQVGDGLLGEAGRSGFAPRPGQLAVAAEVQVHRGGEAVAARGGVHHRDPCAAGRAPDAADAPLHLVAGRPRGVLRPEGGDDLLGGHLVGGPRPRAARGCAPPAGRARPPGRPRPPPRGGRARTAACRVPPSVGRRVVGGWGPSRPVGGRAGPASGMLAEIAPQSAAGPCDGGWISGVRQRYDRGAGGRGAAG